MIVELFEDENYSNFLPLTDTRPVFMLRIRMLRARSEIYLESTIKTQKRVFAKRDIKQTKEDIELLRKLFSMTAQERRKAGIVKKRFEL